VGFELVLYVKELPYLVEVLRRPSDEAVERDDQAHRESVPVGVDEGPASHLVHEPSEEEKGPPLSRPGPEPLLYHPRVELVDPLDAVVELPRREPLPEAGLGHKIGRYSGGVEHEVGPQLLLGGPHPDDRASFLEQPFNCRLGGERRSGLDCEVGEPPVE
jgi:hypothetical protein